MEKFIISSDPAIYEAWPDVAKTRSGKLICVFSECTHHGNREYTRVMLSDSDDRGRHWSAKRPLTEGTAGLPYYYDCARIVTLRDGRLAISVNRARHGDEDGGANAEILLYFSSDDGDSWSAPVVTPLNGIVPDRLTELESGRWLLSAHYRVDGKLTEFLHYSDDGGASWSRRITVACSPELNLCEVSMLPLGGGVVAGFLRENSMRGLDAQLVISSDDGESWGEVRPFPLQGCHRPSTGVLNDGRILISYRYLPGAKPGWGYAAQNLFAALTDRESVLAEGRTKQAVRILPVDFDRSPFADTGYSGWVQYDDDEIIMVNYIVDDKWDKAQIRCYSLRPEDFLLKERM